MQVEEEALNPFRESGPKKTTKGINYSKEQNLEDLPIGEAERRQIKDMKFIRVRVKSLNVESGDLITALNQDTFKLEMTLPLPDINKKKLSEQLATLSNYETLQHNLFAFNSLSLYNFRVDEATLQAFVGSQMEVRIKEHGVHGTLNLNKLIMANDFRLETTIDLEQTISRSKEVIGGGRRKAQQETSTDVVSAGTLTVEINL